MENNSRIKHFTKYFFSYLITIIFVFFLFREINLSQLKSLFSQAKIGYVILGFTSLAIGYLIRGFRWSLMLQRIEPQVSRTEAMAKFVYAIAMNNVLPLRAGDIYRLFCFKEIKSLNSAKVLSTLILERLLDLLMLLLLFFITLPYVQISIIPDYFIHSLQALIITAFILFIVLLTIPHKIKKLLLKISFSNLNRRSKITKKIVEHTLHFTDAVIFMRSPSYIACLTVLSAIAWLLEGGLFLFSAYAMNYHGSLIGPFFASSTGAISTLLPSAPGYIGTFDYFTMIGFKAFGTSIEIATAAALLTHAILWLPIALFGLGYHLFSTHKRNKTLVSARITS